MREGGSGAARLFARQLVAGRAAGLTVLITVLVVAGLVAAWPRAVEQLFTDSIREAMAERTPLTRDLVAVTPGGPEVPSGLLESLYDPGSDPFAAMPTAEQTWGGIHEQLDSARAGMPPLLQRVTGEARVISRTIQPVAAGAAEPHPEFVEMTLGLLADPRFEDEVTFVGGRPPRSLDVVSRGEPNEFGYIERIDFSAEIALSAELAERFRWTIGEARTAAGWSGTVDLVLTGVFDPVDREGEYWSHASYAVFDPILIPTDPGMVAEGRGFVAPAVGSLAGWALDQPVETRAWYPVDAGTVQAREAADLITQLRAFNAATHPLPLVSDYAQVPALRFATGSIDTLDEVRTAQTSAAALIAMVAVGPAGVALAVLGLACRLVVERRRQAISTASARGASPRQLQVFMMTEGLLLGVLPAVAATLAVPAFFTEPVGPIGWVAPLVVGVVPLAMLMLAARPPGPGAAPNRIVRALPRGLLRWLPDMVVTGMAGLAVVLFTRRGLDATAGTDPLLVATPLLVMVALCMVVLRVYPLVFRALTRGIGSISGAITFVGSIRAGRERLAAAPVLALVVGLAIAVYSSVLWTTTQRGAEDAAWQAVGADLRATSAQGFGDEEAGIAMATPGVVEAAPVTDAGTTDFVHDNRTTTVRVFVADTAALAGVYSAVPDAPVLPGGLNGLHDDMVPVLAGGVSRVGGTGEVVIGRYNDRVPIAVVESASTLPGLSRGEPWILADSAAWTQTGVRLDRPRIMLMSASGEVDREGLAEVLRTNAPISSPADHQERFQSGALASGMSTAFMVSVGVAGVLAAAAVVLTMVLGAPGRGRLVSVLRTLGITGRQAQGLVVWEMGPPAVVGILSGLMLGLTVPVVVLSGVDLRPFTGGREQPVIGVDYGLIGWAVALFAVVVMAAVVLATATSRRLRLGEVLRVGEEER